MNICCLKCIFVGRWILHANDFYYNNCLDRNKVDIFYLVSNSCVETNVESSGIVNTSVSHNLIIE